MVTVSHTSIMLSKTSWNWSRSSWSVQMHEQWYLFMCIKLIYVYNIDRNVGMGRKRVVESNTAWYAFSFVVPSIQIANAVELEYKNNGTNLLEINVRLPFDVRAPPKYGRQILKMNLFGGFVIIYSIVLCSGQPIDDQANVRKPTEWVSWPLHIFFLHETDPNFY